MKNYIYLLMSALLLISTTLLVATGPAVPFAGRWKLNVDKSTYPPGMCPRQMTVLIETAGEGESYSSETLYENGGRARAQYTADYSGKEALVRGNAGVLLPVSLKRIDDNNVMASYKRGFQVVATSRRALSADGRVMTITTTSTDKAGRAVTSIGVYDKVTAMTDTAAKYGRQP
jgi:hypothetical protein